MAVFVGFLTGLALVAPVGPVALTLFGIGTAQGRRAAIAGAGGVVLADGLIMPIALASAGLLGGLDVRVVRSLEVAMGLTLVALAVLTVVHAERAQAALGSIRRPTRTLAAMTLFNPLSLVAWLGLGLALPPDLRAPMTLVAFGVGLLAASAIWHTGLAAVSGSLAGRVGSGSHALVTRSSGVVLAGIGVVLVV